MKRLTHFCPPETTAKLRCPERGFYTILRFKAEEEPVLPESVPLHPDDTLLLVEINLCGYADAALTERALGGIEELFCLLRDSGFGLIVRFLYDWSGKNLITEPKSINVILGHIGQLGPVIRAHADRIVLLQGLFVGNWGEMHGSQFIRSDHLKRLHASLTRATGGAVATAVRTPALWRAVTGMSFSTHIQNNAALPGLFNDAMLGNDSEYGTYSQDADEREREQRLQKQLCMFVPYGGEVVGNEPESDAQRAMAALERTGVSYLNRLYDENTLAKWKQTAVQDGSVWNDMSYFDYAEAHLGYRFVIRGVKLRQSLSGALTAQLGIENVGFAPVYHTTAAELVLVLGNSEVVFPMNGNADRLCRGEGVRWLSARLPSMRERLGGGAYEIYFRLRSLKYNVTIPTANQGSGTSGCLIGRYTG